MDLAEITERKALRFRRSIWAEPFDHVEIKYIENDYGPWFKFYSPMNIACGNIDPTMILWNEFPIEMTDLEEYTGPSPESDEYQTRTAETLARFRSYGLATGINQRATDGAT